VNSSNENHWSHRGVLGTVAGAAECATRPGILHAEISNPVRRLNVLFMMAGDRRVKIGCYAAALETARQTPTRSPKPACARFMPVVALTREYAAPLA